MPFDTLRVGTATLELVRGDLARWTADAIVTAANEQLRGGGGVDGAVHDAAGPDVMDELRTHHGRCPTGSAVITGAGRLPARWVIHAVGPIWRGGDQDERRRLESAYRAAMRLAETSGARSIAFPAISCGVYGYPLEEGARVAVETVAASLASGTEIRLASFVLRSDRAHEAFRTSLAALTAP